MNWFFDNTMDWIFLGEMFLAMLVSFLIGYFFGVRKPNHTTISKEKNTNKVTSAMNETETIFSEIKPDILKIIENRSNGTKTPASSTSQKIALNFSNFGYASEIDRDDLTKINGLNPFIEDKLNQLGIYTFSQIGRFTPNDIDTLTQLIGYFPGRIERDDWVDQANLLNTKKATL